jgi:hypothetical protein
MIMKAAPSSSRALWSSVTLFTVTAAAAAYVVRANANTKRRTVDDAESYQQEKLQPMSILTKDELLTRFPALEPAFQQSRMVGLYFCGAWCPDCQAATPAVRRVLQSDANDDQTLAVVYISSDKTMEEMQNYLPACMMAVDFHEVDQRSGLKRYFGACAQSEQNALQVTRKHGIPSLILLDSATARVLTDRGVDHCCGAAGSADQVLEGWKRMLGTTKTTPLRIVSDDEDGDGDDDETEYHDVDDSFDGMSMDDILNGVKPK